jgi:hypothetical protein
MATQQTRTNGQAAASPEPARLANPAPQPVTPPAQPAHPVALPTFSEAPSSINLHFDYKGYEGIQLTLRDVSGSQLLDKLNAVIDRLEKMGATPAADRRRGGGWKDDAGGQGETSGGAHPQCPDGHGEMKVSKKNGGWYCPHVIAESAGKKIYCQQKA